MRGKGGQAMAAQWPAVVGQRRLLGERDEGDWSSGRLRSEVLASARHACTKINLTENNDRTDWFKL